jgi:glycosyltransferase 2 family protein
VSTPPTSAERNLAAGVTTVTANGRAAMLNTAVLALGLVAGWLAAAPVGDAPRVSALALVAAALASWGARRGGAGRGAYATAAGAVRLVAPVVGAAVGLWRRDGQLVYLALAAGVAWGSWHLAVALNGYTRAAAAPGVRAAVLAEVARRRGEAGRGAWSLRWLGRLARFDVAAALAAAALALGARAWLVVGAAVAVFAVQAMVERTLVPPRAKQARWWQRAAVAAAGVGLVGLLKALPEADLPGLLRRVGPAMPLLMAIALVWMAAYARSMRVIIMDRAVGWGRLLYGRLVGEAYNVLTPLAGLGGDPLKILDLAEQVGTARAVRAVVLDRFAYAAGGMIFSAVGTVVAVVGFDWDARIERALLGYVVIALAATALLFLVATRPESSWWTARLLRLARVRKPVVPQVLPPAVFARALLWNVAGRFWGLVEIALLLALLGQAVRPLAVVAVGGLLAVSGIVFFFVPSGLGVAEGAAVFALSATGYGEAVGLAVGLARRVRLLAMAVVGVALNAVWRPSTTTSAVAPAAARAEPTGVPPRLLTGSGG